MFGGVTEVDWTVVRGGVRGNFKAVVCEKRIDEAGGGLGTSETELAVFEGSRTDGLRADEDC